MLRRNLVVFSLVLLSSTFLTKLWYPLHTLQRLNKSKKSQEFILNEINLPKIDERDPILLETDLYRRLFHAEITCPQHTRAGNINDGGWNVCTAGPFTLGPPCLVYSFGINGDWTFDDFMAQNHGCIVRSFDPSIGKVDHQRDEHQWFYNLGLGGSNTKRGDWQLRTFGTLLKQFGEELIPIDYLKFDIEGSEYQSLDAMFKEGSLERVKQIGIEFHIGKWRQMLLWKKLPTLGKLGFKSWNFHENAGCRARPNQKIVTSCVEISYLNTRFLDSNAYSGHKHSDALLMNKYYNKDVIHGFVFFDLPALPEPSLKNSIEVLKSLVQQREVKCPQHEGFGKYGGRRDICSASPFRPSPPCLVYSFFDEPFERYWTFEDGISNTFQCKMHSFVSKGLDIPYNRSVMIISHEGGLEKETSDHDSSRTKPFDGILEQNGDELNIIDILAIGPHRNTELVLQNLLQNAGLARVKQLLIQLTPSTTDSTKALTQISILQMIRKRGFRMCSPPENNIMKPGSPYRLSYLNIKFIG